MTTRRRFLAGLGCAGGSLFGYSSFNSSYGKPTIDKDIEIIGHRGASAKFSDNSIEGIRYAGKHGADAVELDIRRTADDRLVLNHNPFVMNISGAQTIRDVTYNELLETTDRISTFSEAMSVVKKYDMELVAGMKEPHNSEYIWNAVKEANYADNSYMSMWNRDLEDHLVDPERTMIVTAAPNTDLIESAKEYGIDSVMCHYIETGIDAFIDYAHSNGIKAGYWTLSESREDLVAGLSKDPDVIMTNRPKQAVELIRGD